MAAAKQIAVASAGFENAKVLPDIALVIKLRSYRRG
jgi:hypothetical protein